jgi:hypothetical protein
MFVVWVIQMAAQAGRFHKGIVENAPTARFAVTYHIDKTSSNSKQRLYQLIHFVIAAGL